MTINVMLHTLLQLKKRYSFLSKLYFCSSIYTEGLLCLISTEVSWKTPMALDACLTVAFWTDVEEQIEVIIKKDLEQNSCVTQRRSDPNIQKHKWWADLS